MSTLVKNLVTGVVKGTTREDRSIHWDSGHWASEALCVQNGEVKWETVSSDWAQYELVYATEEEQAVYSAWKAEQEAKAKKAQELRDMERTWQYLHTPVKGDYVKNISKRSKNFGSQGIVFWIGTDDWGNRKVGIKETGTDKAVFMTFEVIAVLSPLDEETFVPVKGV